MSNYFFVNYFPSELLANYFKEMESKARTTIIDQDPSNKAFYKVSKFKPSILGSAALYVTTRFKGKICFISEYTSDSSVLKTFTLIPLNAIELIVFGKTIIIILKFSLIESTI